MAEHTLPNRDTRSEEAAQARVPAGPGPEPAPDDLAAADDHTVDPEVAEAEKDANRRGADAKGEGRLP